MMVAKRMVPGISRMARAGVAVIMAMLLTASLAGTGAQQAAAAGSPTITVTNAATGKVSLKKGATYSLGAKAPGAKVTYKSSKKSVVTVSKKGKLTAKKTGKATITVTAKKGSAKTTKKVKVTVLSAKKYKAVKKISSKVATNDLLVGMSATIKTSFNPSKASNKNLLFKSSNTGVLTVSAKGVVKAKKAGTAKVTVTSCANKKAKSTVEFTVVAPKPAAGGSGGSDSDDDSDDNDEPDVQATSVELSQSEAEIEAGQDFPLEATVTPADATETEITWMTSDTNVASVDDGVVTGTGPGLAVITAKAPSGASADCEVRVNMAGTAEFDAYLESYGELVAAHDADLDFENLPDNPYCTARLIVKDDGSGFDSSAFEAEALYDGEGTTILQFATPEAAQTAMEEIDGLDGVEWVEPDMYVEASGEGEESEGEMQLQWYSSYLSWGVKMMGLDAMAESLRGKKGGVIVAVVDSGLTPEHELFRDKIVPGGGSFIVEPEDLATSVISPKPDSTEDLSKQGHGTHVAGIIADCTQALPGIKILPERGLCQIDDTASLTLPKLVADAIKHAVNHGAKVINLSNGVGAYLDNAELIPIKCVNDAVKEAREQGVTVVTAAGNSNGDVMKDSPSNCPDAIVVGAIEKNGERWEKSCFGETLKFVAPGVDITSCAKDGGTQTLTGTSFAAPHIAAAAAMIKLQHPEYSPTEIEDTLKKCSEGSERDNWIGYGMPDLSKIATGFYFGETYTIKFTPSDDNKIGYWYDTPDSLSSATFRIVDSKYDSSNYTVTCVHYSDGWSIADMPYLTNGMVEDSYNGKMKYNDELIFDVIFESANEDPDDYLTLEVNFERGWKDSE